MRRLPVILLALACSRTTWAYGEDIQDDNRSTAHYDITRALARCAGFSAEDATAIAEADQAADSLTYGATTIHFAERTGENSESFHFPEASGAVDADGNGPVRTWALGQGTLAIPACDTNGRCCDGAADGGGCVDAGSLQAIGLWLHAAGDYWSHHACIGSGGMNHGMYDHDDEDETFFCDGSMHSHEWGRRDAEARAMLLQDNALAGLRTVRAQIDALAESRGYVRCGQISDDDLVMYASAIGGDARTSFVSGLYSTCDAITACGPMDPEGDTTTPRGDDSGCASGRDVSWLSGLAIFALLVARKRRR